MLLTGRCGATLANLATVTGREDGADLATHEYDSLVGFVARLMGKGTPIH